MTHYPMMHDADLFPEPETFDALRFFNLRKEKGQEERHQFASLSSEIPLWGVGKFACPGRFWASAQIKLILMILLLEFEVVYPDGQINRPKNIIVGEKNQVSMSQKIILKRRLA
jgi:cytochrome P450